MDNRHPLSDLTNTPIAPRVRKRSRTDAALDDDVNTEPGSRGNFSVRAWSFCFVSGPSVPFYRGRFDLFIFTYSVQVYRLAMKTLHTPMSLGDRSLGKGMLPCLMTKGPRLTPIAGKTTIVRRPNGLRHQVSMLKYFMAYVHRKDIDVLYAFANEQMFHPRVSCHYLLRCLPDSGFFDRRRTADRLVFFSFCRALFMYTKCV